MTASSVDSSETSGRGLDLKALETNDERHYEDISELPVEEKQLLIDKLRRELTNQYGERYPMWNIVDKIMSTSVDLCQSNAKLRKQLRANTDDKKAVDIKCRKLKHALKKTHRETLKKVESKTEELDPKEIEIVDEEKMKMNLLSGVDVNTGTSDLNINVIENSQTQCEVNIHQRDDTNEVSSNQDNTGHMLPSASSNSDASIIQKNNDCTTRENRSSSASDSDSQHEEHLDKLYRILSNAREQGRRGYKD